MSGKTIGMAGAVAVAFALAAPVAHAQIQVGTRVGEAPPVSTGGYSSLGRRDPFISLIVPRSASNPNVPRASHGLGSFLLADVKVTGISRVGDVMMAILQGADRQSYVAKVNDRIADAVIRRIDAEGVVFATTPGAGRGHETKKLLRSAAEVNR